MSADGKWGDLPARVLSAIVMVAIGVAAVWLGGVWFRALVAVIGGGMMWELTRMMNPERASQAITNGVLVAAVLFFSDYLPDQTVIPLLLAPAIAGAIQIDKNRLIFASYGAFLTLACLGFILMRDRFGVGWVAWLALVVIATDVAGYFAGRIIGGPKFWPKVSPKKTWAGIIAGWIAAACVGAGFGGTEMIVISVLTSFASQMGDAAESAIKRRVGVKDSSNLIPGHGGLMDRFDAMMGAAFFILLWATFLGLPQGL